MADKNEKDNSHLDIYLDRYELYQNNIVTTYYEGFQNAATQKRYEKINNVLAEGYLYKIMTELPDVDFEELLSFDEWLAYQTKHIAQTELDRISERWLLAVVESFVQRRPEIAPIDEPCEAWVQDLIKQLNAKKV